MGIAVRNIQRLAREIVAPLVGMAFLWAFFRYQNFFMLLYPQGISMPAGSVALPAQTVSLVALVFLIVLALIGWRRVTRLTVRHRSAVLLCCALGSLGTALALLHKGGLLGTDALWVSTPLVAVGFLASLLAWGTYLSSGFNRRKLVVIVVSYLASLLIFRHAEPNSLSIVVQNVFTVAIPLGSGLGWIFSPPDFRDEEEGGILWGLQGLTNPFIWLFAAFLLAGSVIRGIVDIAVPSLALRHRLSIVIVSCLVLACLVYTAISARRSRQGGSFPERLDVTRFAVACWIAFASLFFCGTIMLLVMGDSRPGGSVVVIARSMLGVSYWILLCTLSSRDGIAPVPLFLACEALVETVSWLLSYVVVPLVASSANLGDTASPQMFAAVTVCGLAAVVAVICGAVLIAPGRRTELTGMDSKDTQEAPDRQLAGMAPCSIDGDDAIDLLVGQRGLTPREALVAVRYAHGYSLKKVSDELDITNGSAQSYMRSVYRKLGIHTKDELITIVDGL